MIAHEGFESPMLNFALVALGGALGAMSRYALATVILPGSRFPWATLAINIAGSFLIGLIWGHSAQQQWFQEWGRLFLVVGVLGGFTTFSAFSLETLSLIDNHRFVDAFGYVLLSVSGCVVATWFGNRFAGW
ncbi:MAG: fluoride efflux transporter CrcB [Proteobacteria bacterium]|nr:fluoride efflux transporter CrcB [Pseudomonadota bacterium]